ncbi:hypothetical protein EIK77_004912 [Talaromyces pinophilus]|nr:hypothetical protein EIK77_004912 [Talaromyces pinophilus]
MPPRKSTSSMPPTDNEDPGSPTTAAGAQITEQQAKAQSDGVSVEVLLPLFLQVHRGREALADKKKAQKDRKAAHTSETQAETKDGGEVGVVPTTSEGRDVTAAATSTSSVTKGNKRIKRDSAGNEKHSPDETEVDEDETEEEEAEPEEEEEDEEVEEEEDDETQEAEDLDRVEDLDGKMQGDYDDSDSEDDDNGPAAQLRGFG